MTLNRFLFLLLINLLFYCNSFAQDSLLRIDLSKFVYHFDIENGKLIGPGASLLEKETKENQYFLLGEYHGSPGIAKLTTALIPLLDKAGYKNFALEVGPHSVEILKDLSNPPSETTAKLRTFNQRYNYVEADGYPYTAIPFFEYVEDAQFLQTAVSHQWNLFGLDQEFFYSFLPLLDRMFDQLNKTEQKTLAKLHQEAKDSILHYYQMDQQDGKALSLSIRDSKTIHTFLEKASRANNKNLSIAEAIKTTVQIYAYNATRKYYDCNRSRIEYMKQNLRQRFNDSGFDLSKDKLFVKMGGVHTAKGLSWLSLYEIGNTLSELAAFHGNKSIHIAFQNRFYLEDGKVIDQLEDEKSYGYKYKDFNQFAKKDQWTLIDLRPVKKVLFYSRKYQVPEIVKRTFEQHDIIIIPKLEGAGTPNY